MNWLSIVSLFAKPLGNAVNNLIAAGSASVITYAATKGIDAGITTPIVASVALALSTIISGFAATQGVQIPIINQDTNNGVRVVSSDAAKAKGLAPAPGPKA